MFTKKKPDPLEAFLCDWAMISVHLFIASLRVPPPVRAYNNTLKCDNQGKTSKNMDNYPAGHCNFDYVRVGRDKWSAGKGTIKGGVM